MMDRKLFLFTCALCIKLCLVAQPPQPQKFLPVLAPSSPEAAAFERYGNYQVNLFTGVPDISIPLYSVKVGELMVPISLNYHSSGIKVNDIPSRIGLGWDLQAGGSITRKIMGRPDELPGNYLSATSTSENRVKTQLEIDPNTQVGQDYLYNVDVGTYDVEPDIFSYSFPGHSGKFLFNQKNSFIPVLLPYAPVSIAMTNPPSNLTLAISDESGINYKFGITESTNTGSGINVNCSSAWLLSDMISANKQDTVHFNYVQRTGGGITDSYYSEYLVLNDACTGIYSGAGCTTTGQIFNDLGSVNTVWQQLTQIDFNGGRVVFEAAPETRQDFSSQYQLQNRLNAVKIYNYDPASKTYNMIRSIYFFHSYFMNGTDNATKRLRLDSIQVNTGTGTAIQTYKFNYNTTVALPSNVSKMKDYWGYFNNVTNLDINGNPTSIKKMQVVYNPPSPGTPFNVWVGGDHTNARDPDPNYMQADILQKITFPTGGYTQFEYETNQYLDDVGTPTYAGGLRIKSIKSYTSSTATPVVKTYKYGQNESGYGRANFLLEDHFFISVQNVRLGRSLDPGGQQCLATPNFKTTRTFFANPTNDLESFDGAPVVYPFVTEYIGDGTTNAGKTTYVFSDKADAKTSIVGYGKPMLTSYHFVRGLLSNKSEWRRNADNSYSLVSENRKKYQYFPFANTTGGIGLAVFKTLVTADAHGLNYMSGGGNCDLWSDNNSYLYNNYEVVTGDNKIITDTAIAYDQNDPTKFNSTITSYTYDDITHLQTTQTQTVNSKNETITSAFTYPYNYGTSPYTSMTTNHIYDKIVQTTITNSVSGQLSQQTNNFNSFSGNNYLPANIQLKVKSNTVETRASFNQYDVRGNILEMQKTNDIKQSFIWDYSNTQPIAEVTGAAKSDIAYTSFEADGAGGWSGITILGFGFNGSVTGKRAYTQSNFSFSKTGLSATTYTVSYWSKSGAYAVNGTVATTLRTINGWTLYQHTVVNPVSGSITVSGTGTIDELRLYPSAALMKTYTYEPLIGVSSICDANNHILYYIYDEFSRLGMVKDEDGNILKKNCYNYNGQPGDCSLFGNNVQTAVYTRNNCAVNNFGSQVTNTVPANVYYASTQTNANTLAQNDLAANGQLFANIYGSCTPGITITGSNNRSIDYTVKFTRHSDGIIVSSFPLPSGANNITLGVIPSGTYDVQFQPGSSPVSATFGIGSNTFGPVTGGALFTNILLNVNTLARAF